MSREPSIPLHPKKGLNPHLTFCPRCGQDGNEIALLGKENWIYKCETCDLNSIGKSKNSKCHKCNIVTHLVKTRELEDNERIPGSICNACIKEQKEYAKIVAKGGIYFRCINCKASGVIKSSNSICQTVRDKLNVPAPEPCGIELTRNDCLNCRGKI